MKKPISITLIMFLAVCTCGMPAACYAKAVEETVEITALEDCPLVYNPEKAGIVFQISIDAFNALGFSYGDSVDLSFSNGFFMEDIPYYNGYYVETGQPLLVAYPGSDYIKAALNYGDDLWTEAGLSEGDTGSIFLYEKGKYEDVQKACAIQYTDNREDYASDEVFANFRNVTAGNIKENILYRSASPCDNRYNRAPYVDDLAEAAGVQTIVNLADKRELIDGYIEEEDFDSPYFLSLYQEDRVLPLYLSINFLSEDFKNALSEGLTEMSENEGPYLVHCTEGKDRTGFVCILLEALCGASYEELEEDYMLTYDNYYGISKESDPDRYNTIRELNLDAILREIVSDENIDITDADYTECAKKYLSRIGVSEETVKIIRDKLQED